MAITNYNRKYSITITFKEGYGDEITVESPNSSAIYNDFNAYINGHSSKQGFELVNEDGSACIYLFCAVAKICRTAIEKEETTAGACQDIDPCDLMNARTETPEDGGTSAP